MISEQEKAALRQDFALFAAGWPYLDFDLTVREGDAAFEALELHLTAGRHSEEEDA